MKKIAILQSNYIPWKGYFDLINSVDEFVLFDDMQFTKRDWRNRNKIKSPSGLLWLTIPVKVKGNYYQKISETETRDNVWREQHWKSITHNYSRSRFFNEFKDLFQNLYLGQSETSLSMINYHFLIEICRLLGISTQISWSKEYKSVSGKKTERLVEICKQAGATEYLSGPAAEDYIIRNLFERENIQVKYISYTEYPEYTQLYPPFEHGVSILDLIFNEGNHAYKFMKSFS